MKGTLATLATVAVCFLFLEFAIYPLGPEAVARATGVVGLFPGLFGGPVAWAAGAVLIYVLHKRGWE